MLIAFMTVGYKKTSRNFLSGVGMNRLFIGCFAIAAVALTTVSGAFVLRSSDAAPPSAPPAKQPTIVLDIKNTSINIGVRISTVDEQGHVRSSEKQSFGTSPAKANEKFADMIIQQEARLRQSFIDAGQKVSMCQYRPKLGQEVTVLSVNPDGAFNAIEPYIPQESRQAATQNMICR